MSVFNQDYFKNRGLLKKRAVTLNHFWIRYFKPVTKLSAKRPRLLDLGCGVGKLLRRVEPYYETVGMDISEWAVEYCNSNLKTTKVTQGDITNLSSFSDGYFDIICAFEVLEHIKKEELPGCLNEIKRCLKKGGILLITTPNLLSPLLKVKKSQWHGFTDKTHISLMKPEEWAKLINSVGLDMKYQYGSGLWDTPFIPIIPAVIQKYLIAAPFIVLFSAGLRFPLNMSDSLIIVASN